MPACCPPAFHPVSASAPVAASALWLAVSFQPSVKSGAGSDAVNSGSVQSVLRPAFAARTRATSAGVMKPPVLPKL